MLRQVLSAKLLLDPAALAASVNVFSPYVTTDATLDSSTIVGLGAGMPDLRSSDLVTIRTAARGITKVDGATVVTSIRIGCGSCQRRSGPTRWSATPTMPSGAPPTAVGELPLHLIAEAGSDRLQRVDCGQTVDAVDLGAAPVAGHAVHGVLLRRRGVGVDHVPH